MNRKRESVRAENLSNDAEENWKILFRHLRKKLKVDEIVQILERDQIVFKPGQMFTKDLTNCKNPGEFRLKNDTIMKNQGMFKYFPGCKLMKYFFQLFGVSCSRNWDFFQNILATKNQSSSVYIRS